MTGGCSFLCLARMEWSPLVSYRGISGAARSLSDGNNSGVGGEPAAAAAAAFARRRSPFHYVPDCSPNARSTMAFARPAQPVADMAPGRFGRLPRVVRVETIRTSREERCGPQIIGATTVRDPWDASRPTSEITRTKCISSLPTFATAFVIFTPGTAESKI